VWGLVTAATRAFPIQLSPSVEKAQEMMAAGAGEGDMLSTWIMQVRPILLTVLPAAAVFYDPAALPVTAFEVHQLSAQQRHACE
jgi:hypothetical protein